MKKVLGSSLMALAFLSSTYGMASTVAKKEAFHCADAQGKEVEKVKDKKDCLAPNKWTKASEISSKDHHDAAKKAP